MKGSKVLETCSDGRTPMEGETAWQNSGFAVNGQIEREGTLNLILSCNGYRKYIYI